MQSDWVSLALAQRSVQLPKIRWVSSAWLLAVMARSVAHSQARRALYNIVFVANGVARTLTQFSAWREQTPAPPRGHARLLYDVVAVVRFDIE